MPIEKLTGADAWRVAARNKFSRYPRPEAGAERLFPLASPRANPTFSIEENSKIFTIGSCFAREVDRALSANGFTVVSRKADLGPITSNRQRGEGVFNKYTAPSILNELEWALNGTPAGEEAFIEVDPGKWFDPHLGGGVFLGSYDEISDYRREFTSVISNVAAADIFIMTLGLVECWYDKLSGLYMNTAAPLAACRRYPDRFEFHVLEYEEILDCLERIWALVKSKGKPGVRMLLTVSPVALLSTFRKQDVLVANSYSKAVQRAAAERFVSRHEDVDYFPSFEHVSLTDPALAWDFRDYRHVNPDLVRRIMRQVMTSYVGKDETSFVDLEADLQIYYRKGKFQKVIDLALSNADTALSPRALYMLGLAYRRVNDFEGAIGCFESVSEAWPTHKNAHLRWIEAARKIGDAEALVRAETALAERFPSSNESETGVGEPDRSIDHDRQRAVV